MVRMFVGSRTWPEIVGEAVPDLKHGADRVLLNERLSNGMCNLKVERFGEAVEVTRYKSQVACDVVYVVRGETENQGVFVMHMFWREGGVEEPEEPEVTEVSDG